MTGGQTGPVFLGTAAFAVPILEALAASRHRPSLVVTRIDSKAGRGLRESMTPVAEAAGALGLPVVKTARPSGLDCIPEGCRLAVSAAFGLWLPESFIGRFVMGVLNVHPSLLPRLRGPCPIERAILGGDRRTGISFMLTDSGWDTGPVVSAFPTPIHPGEDSGMLSARLAGLAAREIGGVIDGYLSGRLEPVPQSGGATRAEKLTDEEARLDWSRPADELLRTIRAFAPSPGARTVFRGRLLKVLSAAESNLTIPPGTLSHSDGILLAGCGQGSIELLRLQPESRKAMEARAFIAGYRPSPGETLG
ncbi:MAG TPA: methionyl-tRNA formyltransferase [Candidatus Fermentibacter daniensis]|nr:methionyl-tRNA formyltransferase [Candidatus Fermentibacter daniensis]HOR06784.1 methionyl-tRNA formyltransferase [Candidatus Fermentibacter daniensis]HPK51013.1 methionyl-tRNA formyltransferase [Candidatus Fermentibacter daniensis]HQE56407.1 methionyl-tRNA formyltransferase [Candidatus Fermentibacter daniensis]HQH92177.1 methionyl-tRNA formyltransferase [Candidatus Fermentibacter daniensis]